MDALNPAIDESYWRNFKIQSEDLEVLSTYLLEVETPLSPLALIEHLIQYRLQKQIDDLESQASDAVLDYFPKERFEEGQVLKFGALEDKVGKILRVRDADMINGQAFSVIEVEFDEAETREFASGLEEHILNEMPEEEVFEPQDAGEEILKLFGRDMFAGLIEAMLEDEDFVYIGGRWFPKALTVDYSLGQLNVAEALLDVVNGGPLSTDELLKDVGVPEGVHPTLASFSLDLALQEDERFDEVGTTGIVSWFLHRLEPNDVRNTPLPLRYSEIEHDRSKLTEDMLDLELRLHDELSPIDDLEEEEIEKVEVRLIFPHWRSGSLPLTNSMAKLFPTASESPRVRFEFVDAESGERYPGWVVREERYVDGLRKWYGQHGLMPGGYVRASQGENMGEIIVESTAHSSNKEWVRTALIGTDGGVVYAMLKQPVQSSFDERMMVYMPSEIGALDERWKGAERKLERVVLHSIRELTKLSPQQHAHASEIYAAVNVVMRCPPAPILALLASHSEISHVGHLHFRMIGAEEGDS